MKEATNNWLGLAKNDLELVRDIIHQKKYPEMVAFHLQQALEKTIKAYLNEIKDEEPPKIHNLITLLNSANLKLPDTELALVEDLNFIYLETRYTANIFELKDFLKEEKLNELYNFVERIIKWIKEKL